MIKILRGKHDFLGLVHRIREHARVGRGSEKETLGATRGQTGRAGGRNGNG